MKDEEEPRIFHILHGDALEVSYTPFGSVGKIFSGEGIEAVWVKANFVWNLRNRAFLLRY